MSKTILPPQSGAAGKYLKSDGTDATWQDNDVATHNTSVDAHANMPVNQGFLKDQNSGLIKFWKGTQAQFDGITPDVETIYFVEV